MSVGFDECFGSCRGIRALLRLWDASYLSLRLFAIDVRVDGPRFRMLGSLLLALVVIEGITSRRAMIMTVMRLCQFEEFWQSAGVFCGMQYSWWRGWLYGKIRNKSSDASLTIQSKVFTRADTLGSLMRQVDGWLTRKVVVPLRSW